MTRVFHTCFLFLSSISLLEVVTACASHQGGYENIDFDSVVAVNNKFRLENRSAPSPNTKFAINNVRVFDGSKLLAPSTVVISGGVIGTDSTGAEHIDGNNGVLLPGLMDTHCHPSNITNLQELTRWGITTAMVMACFSPEACRSLQNHTGLTDVLLGSAAAAAPNSSHGNLIAGMNLPETLLVTNSSDAAPWIDSQVAWRPDFIKLVAETPGLSQETLNALSAEAHKWNKRVVGHAAVLSAYEQAAIAQVDQIHHAPLDKHITAALVAKILKQKQACAPTLTMMKGTAQNRPSANNYTYAETAVRVLYKAGVPIIAGTDANYQPNGAM